MWLSKSQFFVEFFLQFVVISKKSVKSLNPDKINI